MTQIQRSTPEFPMSGQTDLCCVACCACIACPSTAAVSMSRIQLKLISWAQDAPLPPFLSIKIKRKTINMKKKTKTKKTIGGFLLASLRKQDTRPPGEARRPSRSRGACCMQRATGDRHKYVSHYDHTSCKLHIIYFSMLLLHACAC